jgi:hypothetical protein
MTSDDSPERVVRHLPGQGPSAGGMAILTTVIRASSLSLTAMAITPATTA